MYAHTENNDDKTLQGRKIHVSNISQYAVILDKSVPISQYVYVEWTDFLPKN